MGARGHRALCGWEQSGGKGKGTRGRHSLLVVQLAVELLVSVEAGGVQGLLARRALHAALVPQAVVEAQEEAVGDDPLAPLAHGAGRRGSACGMGPVAAPGGRERTKGAAAAASPRVGEGLGVLGGPRGGEESVRRCSRLRGWARALGELRGRGISPDFVPFGKAAAEPRLGEMAVVRQRCENEEKRKQRDEGKAFVSLGEGGTRFRGAAERSGRRGLSAAEGGEAVPGRTGSGAAPRTPLCPGPPTVLQPPGLPDLPSSEEKGAAGSRALCKVSSIFKPSSMVRSRAGRGAAPPACRHSPDTRRSAPAAPGHVVSPNPPPASSPPSPGFGVLSTRSCRRGFGRLPWAAPAGRPRERRGGSPSPSTTAPGGLSRGPRRPRAPRGLGLRTGGSRRAPGGCGEKRGDLRGSARPTAAKTHFPELIPPCPTPTPCPPLSTPLERSFLPALLPARPQQRPRHASRGRSAARLRGARTGGPGPSPATCELSKKATHKEGKTKKKKIVIIIIEWRAVQLCR